MMKKKLLPVLILILLTIGLFSTFALSADVLMMTKDELKALLENPDLVIFDVRMGRDYFGSDLKIKGAIRPSTGAPLHQTLFMKDPGKLFVVYCASNNEEMSTANVKDVLRFKRERYTKIYVLKGGWEEWLKAGYPTEKK